MDFKKHLETAWNLTLRYIVPLVFMTLALIVLGIITLGILAPVTTAGYMQAILLMVRQGREPKLQDLFSQMHLFLPLLGFGVAVFLAAAIGFMLFFLPGVAVIVGVSYFCLYMIPLMTDRKLGLVDAIKESVAMTTGGGLQDQIIVAVIFLGVSSLGGSFIVTALLTQPFATIFLMSVYAEQTAGPPPAPGEEPVRHGSAL